MHAIANCRAALEGLMNGKADQQLQELKTIVDNAQVHLQQSKLTNKRIQQFRGWSRHSRVWRTQFRGWKTRTSPPDRRVLPLKHEPKTSASQVPPISQQPFIFQMHRQPKALDPKSKQPPPSQPPSSHRRRLNHHPFGDPVDCTNIQPPADTDPTPPMQSSNQHNSTTNLY
jgi:hypothetical protein